MNVTLLFNKLINPRIMYGNAQEFQTIYPDRGTSFSIYSNLTVVRTLMDIFYPQNPSFIEEMITHEQNEICFVLRFSESFRLLIIFDYDGDGNEEDLVQLIKMLKSKRTEIIDWITRRFDLRVPQTAEFLGSRIFPRYENVNLTGKLLADKNYIQCKITNIELTGLAIEVSDEEEIPDKARMIIETNGHEFNFATKSIWRRQEQKRINIGLNLNFMDYHQFSTWLDFIKHTDINTPSTNT